VAANRESNMAVEAVWSELSSGSVSLFLREKTGKIVMFGWFRVGVPELSSLFHREFYCADQARQTA